MYILLLVFFQYFNAKQSAVSNILTINNQRQRGAENAWTDKKSNKSCLKQIFHQYWNKNKWSLKTF